MPFEKSAQFATRYGRQTVSSTTLLAADIGGSGHSASIQAAIASRMFMSNSSMVSA